MDDSVGIAVKNRKKRGFCCCGGDLGDFVDAMADIGEYLTDSLVPLDEGDALLRVRLEVAVLQVH